MYVQRLTNNEGVWSTIKQKLTPFYFNFSFGKDRKNNPILIFLYSILFSSYGLLFFYSQPRRSCCMGVNLVFFFHMIGISLRAYI
jgi:hypothetical protein